METRDVDVDGPSRRRWSGRRRVDDVGVEVAQDVVAASSELAGDGDRRQLAVVTGPSPPSSRHGRDCRGERRCGLLRTAPTATWRVPAGTRSHRRGVDRRRPR